MTNIKLAIQAAWQIDEPVFALILALRDHTLRGLCLRCAMAWRRTPEHPNASVWLVCRTCYRVLDAQARQQSTYTRAGFRIPTLTVSAYIPPGRGGVPLQTTNSIWLDITEMRAHVRRRSGWVIDPNGDELFELLGVDKDTIYQTLTSYASAVEVQEA